MTPLFSIDGAGNVIARPRTAAEDRELEIHAARVHIAEAMRRRVMGQRVFALTLLAWAGNCRRRAAAIDVRPAQGELGL